MTLTYDQLDPEKLTPMMRQYVEAKQERPDCILFFRLGDFYELFFDDAITAARELELTLTARECGLPEKAPMCGVPHHSVDNYLTRLIQRGYKIAICDQVEDPATAKGIVKREITRIITPGTVTDPNLLDEQQYHYLAAIYQDGAAFGLAVCDVASGHFATCQFMGRFSEEKLLDELARYQPAELICNQQFADSETCRLWQDSRQLVRTVLPDEVFSSDAAASRNWAEATVDDLWPRASSALLDYLADTQFCLPEHIQAITPYQPEQYMILDQIARRNLELTATLRDRQRKGSLIWAIDRTRTSMGSRLLRTWLEAPLLSRSEILLRQSAVAAFVDQYLLRQTVRELLHGLIDLERLAGRIALRTVHARDLVALAQSLTRLPALVETLATQQDPYIQQLLRDLDCLDALVETLGSTLVDEPPLALKEGGLIRDGFDADVDLHRRATRDGKQWILDLEAAEREKTGIKSLKVIYNRVFGYTIEVTRANLEQVPGHYVRRQTLANAERFITDELKQMEGQIVGAEQRLQALEYELFCALREEVASYLPLLQRNAAILATLDVLAGLAECAERHRYCRPEIVHEAVLEISQGRHAVVELLLPEDRSFVPNDTDLNPGERRTLVLTGPNMAGKSTYMRQVALIVILAQMGGFVPAESARIGLVDRVFTRVGAADDLGGGQSTFMVEMSEMAHILRQATPRSLLILDEIGRGTSTYDGLSIAWSIIEYLSHSDLSGCRTLFATHYHELTDLAGRMAGVFNAHIAVAEQQGKIAFLHVIRPGGSDDSYGIDVAQLAGLPDRVVLRAREILHNLERDNQGKRLTVRTSAQPMDGQIDLFSSAMAFREQDEWIERLRNLDLDRLRPLDALRELEELQEAARRGRGQDG